MLKSGMEIKKRNSINYVYRDNKQLVNKQWLGGMFSCFYDSIMKNSVFPKKFEASLEVHNHFLEIEFKDTHNKCIIELATGSGNVSNFLPSDNKYVGTDISVGLLKIANRKFKKRNIIDFELFASPAEDVPVQDGFADICICNLSLNFFVNIDLVIKEIRRSLKENGVFICTVPVPERNRKQSIIRGALHSEGKLKQMFENAGFAFYQYDIKNGALFYFKAIKKHS